MMIRGKTILGKMSVILAILCVCIVMVSCGDDGLRLRDYIDGKNLQELELIVTRSESPNVTWYIAYSETGKELIEETEVSPFDSKDYKMFSRIDGLEILHIHLGDDVPADVTTEILKNMPDAGNIGFAHCPNADFSVLKSHTGFDEISFTNGCDVSTLPVLDARVLGFGYCTDIPWDVVGQMDKVEQIRYSCKDVLNQYAFLQVSQMQSLKVLYYYSVPYDDWNWGGNGADYTQPPYKISSMDEVEDWVYDTISRESLEQFFSKEGRIMVLFPYMETNPGTG